MLTEIDCVIAGFLGGAFSCGASFLAGYAHFYKRFKNYFYNKDLYKMQMQIKNLQLEIKQINMEHYTSVVNEEYK